MTEPMLSIVVPAFNEAPVIEMTHKRLTNVMQKLDISYEILYVDDGSSDNTLDILKSLADDDPHVVILSFSRNFGQQAATSCGMKYSKGKAVVLIDADLQDPPEVIEEMVKEWKNGADVVYGVRKSRRGETLFKRITSWVYYRVFQFLSGSNAPLDAGDFRLMDRQVVNALNSMPEHNRYIRGMVTWVGYQQVPVEFERVERAAGETKYSFVRMLSLANDGIVGFSVKPLTFAWKIGLLTLLFSLVFFIKQGFYALAGRTVTATTLILGGVFVMLSVVLIMLGILGGYVGRIYDEVKQRPLYIVEEHYTKQ